MKLIKVKCKQCNKKMTVYGNNRKMAIGIDIMAIQNKVDKMIPTCKHHN